MARRGDGIYQRGRTWWLDFVHRGERHVTRLGSNINRTVAKELAQVERGKVLRGEAGIGKKRKDVPLEKAKEEFLARAEADLKQHTVRGYRACLKKISGSPLFAGKRLGQITTWAVERYKQDRLKEGARVRVNRELATLKGVFNHCRGLGLYEGENPVEGVDFLPEPRTRLRYLEPEEEAGLLEAAREPLRSVILIGIHAGLRIQAEALLLAWSDVDLKRGLLTVQAAYAKNGTNRTVPLNSVLRAALARLREAAKDGEHVFTSPRSGKPLKSIRNAFELARKKAGLGEEVTPHTLRHTFASRLAMAGVDLRTIQELGGWKTLSLVERYSHLTPRHRADAVERIAKISQPFSQHPDVAPGAATA
jgi:integrase